MRQSTNDCPGSFGGGTAAVVTVPVSMPSSCRGDSCSMKAARVAAPGSRRGALLSDTLAGSRGTCTPPCTPPCLRKFAS